MRVAIGSVLALFLLAGAAVAAPAQMSVQVREGKLRATASFLGSVVAPVAYGDRVTVMEKKGDWFRVTAPDGAVGWMHTGALTKSKIRLSAGEADAQTGASSDELALAGKGFNADVEAQFKQQNQKIDFTWVDRMEKIKVSAKESQDFLKAGGLTQEQGGAP